MMLMRSKRIQLIFILALAGQIWLACAVAQTASTTTKQSSTGPIIVERRPTAPQVIPVVHKINGIKMLRLLIHSGEQFGALDNIDETFNIKSQVHTSILTGLVLDDGETIAAWLPEADLEVEAPFFQFPPPANRPGYPSTATTFEGFPVDAPDLKVVDRDGKLRPARYLGLDGITGLSVLRLSEKTLTQAPSANEQLISVGQRMRLFSPEPASGDASSSKVIYFRIGETEGQIVNITQRSPGNIGRIRIKSRKALTPASIGGIAVNESGETLGIITSVEGSEASLLPPTVIRGAADRVIARKGNVPRPWLGVSGEAIATTPLAQVVGKGWEAGRAMSLIKKQQGILLTSIAPDSPASGAALHPGDVIMSVNNSDVKSKDDFSSLLEEVGGGNQVQFTLARPNVVTPEVVTVTLSQADFSSLRLRDEVRHPLWYSPLVSRGIEAIHLRPTAATRFGASAGFLVLFVQPDTPAFKSGLKPGDVVEAINGETLYSPPSEAKLKELTSGAYTLNVVRNRQKLVVTVAKSDK